MVDYVVDVVVACVVLFVPALIMILVGVGKWGFLSGLTVGAALGYSFLPLAGLVFPEWIVLAVIVVDFFALFFALKGGF